jgi:hypothetical protein
MIIKSFSTYLGPSICVCILSLMTVGIANSAPPISGSVEESLSTPNNPVVSAALENIESDDCDRKFPMPPISKIDPYGQNDPNLCQRLQIRGQRMQCEIESLVGEKSEGPTTAGTKIELAGWARCNGRIAAILTAGYFLPASEIERRLQICSSNFYADPGKIPEPGWYQRFLRWYTSNDLTPPPSNSSLEAAIKQSTPLESQQDRAGLMKCEWMFSRSKTPQIDPLPGWLGDQKVSPDNKLSGSSKSSAKKKLNTKAPN